MPKPASYTAGWIDTTIHDFLAEIDEPSTDMAYSLLTCLDSSFDVAALAGKAPHLSELKAHGKIVGKGLLVTTRRLLTLERRQRIFFGFDEIWFFPQAKVSPKPKGVVITGPHKIAPAMTERLARWLHGNSGSLGLGDGVGMNFCARLRGVAKHLVESISTIEELAS